MVLERWTKGLSVSLIAEKAGDGVLFHCCCHQQDSCDACFGL